MDEVTYKFNLTSQVFRDNSPIPPQYSCKGQNVSPPLTIMNTPAEAKSLALIMHDPDSVHGDYTHWLVWDIPVGTDMFAANGLPVGAIQGNNGSGKPGYIGPCPPAGTGTHHYIFELYALDGTLGLVVEEVDRNKLEKAMTGHVIAKTTLTGLFDAD